MFVDLSNDDKYYPGNSLKNRCVAAPLLFILAAQSRKKKKPYSILNVNGKERERKKIKKKIPS